MTDWLSRRQGGRIDFRLPGDSNDIPTGILRARILEYLAQVRPKPTAVAPPAAPSKPVQRDSRPRRSAGDPPPVQGDWWTD